MLNTTMQCSGRALRCCRYIKQMSLNPVLTQNRCNSNKIEQDYLRKLPEYTEAMALFSSGKFEKANPLFDRVSDIMKHFPQPGHNDVTLAINFKVAEGSIRSGELNKSIDLLSSMPILDLSNNSIPSVQYIKNLQLLCLSKLMLESNSTVSYNSACDGELGWTHMSANATADYLIEACYALQDEDLYSDCYTLKGLVLLMAKSYRSETATESSIVNPHLVEDVEDYLQKAARWAQDTNLTHQIRALNNLGYLSLCKCSSVDASPPALSNLLSSRTARTKPQSQLVFSDYFVSGGGGSDHNDNEKDDVNLNHCLDAMGYFQEAIALGKMNSLFGNDIFNAESNPSSSGASSMCGTTTALEEDLGMTGLGKDAVFINSEGSTSNHTSVRTSTTVTLTENLKNTAFTVAYCSTQANLASTMLYMANRWGKDDYLPLASEVLSKALENMQNHTTNEENRLSNPDFEQCHTVLSRVLTMVGASHAHATQAVTAEGLYRSIMDMVGGTHPFISHDPRNLYNKSLALYQYGKLLTKWEKRESVGREMQSESEVLLKPLLPSTSESHSITNNRIVFPSGILLPHVG